MFSRQPAAGRSEDSQTIASYFRGVEEQLLARGRLRTDGGASEGLPAPAVRGGRKTSGVRNSAVPCGAEAPRTTGKREGGIPNETSGCGSARRTMTRKAFNFIEEHNPTTLMVIRAAGSRAWNVRPKSRSDYVKAFTTSQDQTEPTGRKSSATNTL